VTRWLEDIDLAARTVGAQRDRAYAKGFEVDLKILVCSFYLIGLFIPFHRKKAHKVMRLIPLEG
jgi:hypothetical protein